MSEANVLRTVLHRGVGRLREMRNGRNDAQLLLLRVLERDRAWVLAHPDATLSDEQLQRYDEWIARRERREPVQYILGEQEFYGLMLRVTPEVLIPRPETEHLVEAVLERVPKDAAVRICDVGTGSGAIAVALAHALPLARVTAVDLSAAALEVARENAGKHGVAGRITFLRSDLLAALRGETFDVVVSNPPYVANGEILEAQVRLYEPHEALFAGPTGLEVYGKLIPQAREVLAPGGCLLMELGEGQHEAVAGMLSPQSAKPGLAGDPDMLADWDGVRFVDDLQAIPRVAIAQRRG